MKLKLPNYYKKFKCIADKCTDNCCIGWEIDIDEKTAEFYETVGGEMGKRLRDSIKDRSFILKNQRCPFLNDCNLCDIIIELGEEGICSICTEHPRYYGWYGDIKEGGIGICCEEAARLILTEDNGIFEADIHDEETEAVDKALYGYLDRARQQIFEYLSKPGLSFNEKAQNVLFFAEELQDELDFGTGYLPEICPAEFDKLAVKTKDFISAFAILEPIDSTWEKTLSAIAVKAPCINEEYLSKIFAYYIWRYFMRAVFDLDALSKVRLAALSCIMIALISEGDDLQSYISAAKLYSKEVEYSEENLEALLEMTYTDPVFSSDYISALLSLY